MLLTIDIGTLYVAAAVVAGFFGIGFLSFHAIDSTTPGILQWGVGYFLVAVGLILTVLQDALPLLLWGPVAGFLFVSAAILLDAGMRREDEPSRVAFDVVVPLVALALLLFFAYLVPSPAAHLEVLLFAVALATSRTSVRLIRRIRAAEEGLRTALITFAVIYTILAATLIVLGVVALFTGPFPEASGSHLMPAVLPPALMLFFIGAGMSKVWVHYMRAYVEVRRAATIDPLTGVHNRRYIMPEFERLFQRSKREARRLACLMLDADEFKSVNDTYGHRKGDEVLELLAQRITEAVREYDLVGRYGGEEFIIIVPDQDPEDVMSVARRLHESIRSKPMAGLELTVSVGVAFLSKTDDRPEDLIQRADRALYRAKRSGRDQVAVGERHTEQ